MPQRLKAKAKTSTPSSVTDGVSSAWLTPTSHAVPIYVTPPPGGLTRRLTQSHMAPAGPLVTVMDSGYSLFKKAPYGPKERAW